MSDIPPLPAPVNGASLPPPPPHALDGEWFLHINGSNYGPYTGHTIKTFIAEGRVNEKTSVCPAGHSEWISASKDAALATLFRAPPVGTSSSFVHNVPAVVPQAPGAPTSEVSNNGGTVVQITQHFGPGPGYHPAFYAETGPKSPSIALLLSFFLPGVGQMYNGQVGKGIGMLLLCIVLWFVFLGWIIWIWAMIDAYSSAKSINIQFHQRAGQQWPSQ